MSNKRNFIYSTIVIVTTILSVITIIVYREKKTVGDSLNISAITTKDEKITPPETAINETIAASNKKVRYPAPLTVVT
jgi:hypothetical protein